MDIGDLPLVIHQCPSGRAGNYDNRIGVLLDLDAGWLRFYRNDKRCGPGFTEGVTGPLVRAVQLCNSTHHKGEKAVVLPGAVAPEGAGAADEPRPPPLEQEPESDY